jgi:hypothetical protein
MRVGIRTEAFGSIQVHTVVHNSEVGLSLGSERGDLRTFFANELPALENNLRQHELHFESVRFASNPAAMGGNPHGGPGQHSQPRQEPRGFAGPRALPHAGGGKEPAVEGAISKRRGLSLHV